MGAPRRGRPVDPDSLTQRILTFLGDDQWYDTREIGRHACGSTRLLPGLRDVGGEVRRVDKHTPAHPHDREASVGDLAAHGAR